MAGDATGFAEGEVDEGVVADVVSTAESVLRDVVSKEQTDGVGGQPLSRAGWDAVVQTGWLGAGVGAERGGLGLGISGLTRLAGVAGRSLIGAPLIDHSLALAALDRLGADAEVPAEIASGRKTLAVAWPGTEDREGYLLRHGFADAVLVASAGAIYAADGPGVTINPLGGYDPGAGLSILRLDAGAIPMFRTEWRAVSSDGVLDGLARLLVAAELAGIGAAAIDLAVDYARIREQFGQQIGAFQAIKHMLVGGWTKTRYLQNMCEAAARSLDTDLANAALAGAAAKTYAARAARQATEVALQVHGGIGFTTECAVHGYLKRALSWEGYLGDEDELAQEIGRETLRA